MPWKDCKPMDERFRFMARLLEGEKMAPQSSTRWQGAVPEYCQVERAWATIPA